MPGTEAGPHWNKPCVGYVCKGAVGIRRCAIRTKAIFFTLAAILLLASLGLCLVQADEHHKLKVLRENLGQIQLAVERFAVDTEGAYPSSLDILLARGYLAGMPINPYSRQPMQVLEVVTTPAAGDIVYVPCGPIIAIGNLAATGEHPILPTELDQYLLAAYGPVSAADKRSFPRKLAQWQEQLGGADSLQYKAIIAGHPINVPSLGGATELVMDYKVLVPDWELFMCRLSAGEDFVP